MKKSLLITTAFPMTMGVSALKSPDWIKSAVFMQIYPSSFQDSNGDLKFLSSSVSSLTGKILQTIP